MKRGRLSVNEYFQGIRKGDRVILSKAITLVESTLDEDRLLAKELVDLVLPYSGNSIRIGITGIPGVGKSSFIEKFGRVFIELYNKRVCVLAVDPTSQKTHGSILGDKTRMEELSNMEDAFIRPSPAGISLGGVAAKTREAMLLCEAAGFNVVFVETVGVGQSEVAVNDMTDIFLLLTMAGTGDELQGIKKGIMEMADLIVINKSDGENLKASQKTKGLLEMVLHLFPKKESSIDTSVFNCSSIDGSGINQIGEKVMKVFQKLEESKFLVKERGRQNKQWTLDYIEEKIVSNFYNSQEVVDVLDETLDKVQDMTLSPYKAAENLLRLSKTSS